MDKLSYFQDGRGNSRTLMTTTFYSQISNPLPPFNHLPLNTSFDQVSGIPSFSQPPVVPPSDGLRKLLRNPYGQTFHPKYKSVQPKNNHPEQLQPITNIQQKDEKEKEIDLEFESKKFKRFLQQRKSQFSQGLPRITLDTIKHKRVSSEGQMEREQQTKKQVYIPEADSIYKNITRQPLVNHMQTVNVSQQIARFKKKKNFNAYRSNMSQSFSMNRPSEKFFEVQDQGQNSLVSGKTQTGFTTSWMVHNHKKPDPNKQSLVVIRQRPKCLSSLGDKEDFENKEGNKRYKEFNIQRVMTSISAPIQDEENQNLQNIRGQEPPLQKYQKTTQEWSKLRPGTEVGGSVVGKPMSSVVKFRQNFQAAAYQTGGFPQSTDPMQKTASSFNSINFQAVNNKEQPSFQDFIKSNLDKNLQGINTQMDRQNKLIQRMKEREFGVGNLNKNNVRFVVIEEDQQEN